MATATITSKGQITIPKEVRDTLRLRTGDRVAFIIHDHVEAVLKPINKSVDQVFGMLHTPHLASKTIVDMNQAIARRMRGTKS
ncbi:MAG: AbrB/MazE/SpoVT family DNA-binding domain-containing protein [Verrucomicrobia bacterium]|nr:AbrB/MazE/SpoVT family DNA-binding domain-containing protein [Verrucomicrobiota bacterium]